MKVGSSKMIKTNVCAVWPVRIVSTPKEQRERLTGGVSCHLLGDYE